jgi:hypothetical protein
MAFPTSSYTPFGYLANPYHRARTYADVEAGLLRSTDDVVGFGWVEPTARRPTTDTALLVGFRWNDRLYVTRSDFARLGLESRHHTSTLFSYDWHLGGVRARLSFALESKDSLVTLLELSNEGPLPVDLELFLLGRVRADRGDLSVVAAPDRLVIRDRRTDRSWTVAVDRTRRDHLCPPTRTIRPFSPDSALT